jgi:putative FmdB family regulatory protein
MPTYEYHCENCGNDFELLQSMKSDSYADCPKCFKKATRKVSLSGGLVFKGSGFYINDYKKSGSKSASSDSSSNSSKNDTSGSKNDTGGSKNDAGGSKNDAGGSKNDNKKDDTKGTDSPKTGNDSNKTKTT